MRRRERGFTLIELMIVIAIIAIIAAIAIPGLLRARMAANERSASASLRTVFNAEEVFRNTDPGRTGGQFFWAGDLCGLYNISNRATPPSPIKVVQDAGLAGADVNPLALGPYPTAAPNVDHLGPMSSPSAKSGYVYSALNAGGSRDLLLADTYAYLALPARWGRTGGNKFFMAEEGTIYRSGAAAYGSVAANTPADQAKFDTEAPTDFSNPSGVGWSAVQ